VREEQPPPLDEVVQSSGTGPEQFQYARKPGGTLVSIALAPEAGVAKQRFHPLRQVVHRHARDVLLVEPLELLWIEYRVASADALERESADKLLAGEDLFITASRRPAKQGEKVHHGFGQDSPALILADGGGAVPFRQAFLVRTKNQRYVGEER